MSNERILNQVIAKSFENFFIGPTQTYNNYKLDPPFTPAYVPFPSPGARDDRKEKALSRNEGVEVPTRSFFFFSYSVVLKRLTSVSFTGCTYNTIGLKKPKICLF